MDGITEPMDQLVRQLDQDNPNADYWADKCLRLSRYLYALGVNVAQAETKEKTKITDLIDMSSFTKRMSVAEAEKRAVVETGNEYGLLKIRYDSAIEIINAIKAKLRTMGGDLPKRGEPF